MDEGKAIFAESNQTPNTEYLESSRQTVGAKVYRREEKSPDRRLRSPNHG